MRMEREGTRTRKGASVKLDSPVSCRAASGSRRSGLNRRTANARAFAKVPHGAPESPEFQRFWVFVFLRFIDFAEFYTFFGFVKKALLKMLGWRILQEFQSLFHFLKKRCFHICKTSRKLMNNILSNKICGYYITLKT